MSLPPSSQAVAFLLMLYVTTVLATGEGDGDNRCKYDLNY